MTTRYKILIDTNVFIGLEDAKPVSSAAADLVRKCAEHGISLFIHAASVSDIQQDKQLDRQQVSLSKLAKFQNLPRPKLPAKADLEACFGAIRKRNDEVDVELLYTLKLNAVDLLVTEDKGIHDRAKLSALGARVLTVADTLSWLRRTLEPTTVRLPFIQECLAHEIDPQDSIFESLREGYPDFDAWWDKCIQQHRSCWTVTIADDLAGLIVRKDETQQEAGTRLSGARVLKICTFKVRPEFRGEKLGELLLKQALWYAQRNGYDVVYLTTFPDQTTLIRVLEYFGFVCTDVRPNGEQVYEKSITRARLDPSETHDLFRWDRLNYPRFVARAPAQAFCIPIKGEYHNVLFPEIARGTPLPLLPGQDMLPASGRDRKPGNTIRKVYLSHANTRNLSPGDVLVFYHSKHDELAASQSITSIGIAEQAQQTSDLEELVRLTAKRSVYSETQLKEMLLGKTVLVIDFLLIGHLDDPIPLETLLSEGVFNRHPPQSICQLPPERFEPIRRRLSFGFEV